MNLECAPYKLINLDALYLKVRENNRFHSRGLLIGGDGFSHFLLHAGHGLGKAHADSLTHVLAKYRQTFESELIPSRFISVYFWTGNTVNFWRIWVDKNTWVRGRNNFHSPVRSVKFYLSKTVNFILSVTTASQLFTIGLPLKHLNRSRESLIFPCFFFLKPSLPHTPRALSGDRRQHIDVAVFAIKYI
jgi:hypothetical protein